MDSINEKTTEPIIDMDIGKAGVHATIDGEIVSAVDENGKPIAGRYPYGCNTVYHPDAYERQAQTIATEKTAMWIRQHPEYSLEELKSIKAGFLEAARCEIRKSISELNDKRREDLISIVKQLKKRRINNEEIATMLDIPESTVREYAK